MICSSLNFDNLLNKVSLLAGFLNAFQALSLPEFGTSRTSDVALVLGQPVSFPFNSSLFHLAVSTVHAEEKENNLLPVASSPSVAPDALIPLLAPSPLHPFFPNPTVPVLSGNPLFLLMAFSIHSMRKYLCVFQECKHAFFERTLLIILQGFVLSIFQ